jgi:hypothetical protein
MRKRSCSVDVIRDILTMMNKKTGRIRWSRLLLAMIAGMLTRTVDLHWHTHLADAVSSDHPTPLVYLANAAVPHLAFDQDVDIDVAGDEAGKAEHRFVVDTPHKPFAFLTTAQLHPTQQHGARLAALQPSKVHRSRLDRSVIRPPLRAPPV